MSLPKDNRFLIKHNTHLNSSKQNTKGQKVKGFLTANAAAKGGLTKLELKPVNRQR